MPGGNAGNPLVPRRLRTVMMAGGPPKVSAMGGPAKRRRHNPQIVGSSRPIAESESSTELDRVFTCPVHVFTMPWPVALQRSPVPSPLHTLPTTTSASQSHVCLRCGPARGHVSFCRNRSVKVSSVGVQSAIPAAGAVLGRERRGVGRAHADSPPPGCQPRKSRGRRHTTRLASQALRHPPTHTSIQSCRQGV